MILSVFEISVHSYSVLTITPTLLANVLLFILLVRQNWQHRRFEGLLIAYICFADLIFSLNIIARYSWIFFNNELEFLQISETGQNDLSPQEQFTCNWSGALLAITMHSSIWTMAVLGYVRYSTIVKSKLHSNLFWAALYFIPVSIMVVLSLVGAVYDKYVVMPGGLGCHVWSPTRDDPFRTPIQAFFSYNILISLVIIVYCYVEVAHHHHRAMERINRRLTAYRLRQIRVLDSPIHFKDDSSSSRDVVNEICTLSEEHSFPSHQEAALLQAIKDEMDTNHSPNPDSTIRSQQHKVKLRIGIILATYILCHFPELVLEQAELLFGWTRSSKVDSICTHFRSLYGLFNAIVVLALHSHTRRELVMMFRQLKQRFTRNRDCAPL